MSYSFVGLFLFVSYSVGTSTTLDGNTTSIQLINSSVKDHLRQGWTPQPDGRGTLDIIWSCAFTMFLCSWSILCLNLPGPHDTPFQIFRRKLYVTALGFLGPEFIFQIALGQWVSGCRSVQEFHASGYPSWTMSHAFFADMGGFILYTKDWTPFPINAKQLHYLVVEGYVAFPALDKRVIADKNKADGLLRLITIIQIFWFVVNVIGRAAQHLAITCVELTTAAFILCSLGITFCWAHKPADVSTPEAIKTDATIAEILLRAGSQAQRPYSRTPLDFVSRKEWPWSIYWSNWINILRNMRINFGPQIRPVNRFENTISLELPRGMPWIFLGLTALYAATFFCGWNYTFPTRTEQALWRAASVAMMGSLVAYWLITKFAFSIYPAIRQQFEPTVAESLTLENNHQTQQWAGHGRFYRRISRVAKSVAACIRNNSVSKDPALDVPLKAILPIYVVAVFYCHARTYIFIADMMELRDLPASAYQTVNWSSLLPHL